MSSPEAVYLTRAGWTKARLGGDAMKKNDLQENDFDLRPLIRMRNDAERRWITNRSGVGNTLTRDLLTVETAIAFFLRLADLPLNNDQREHG